MDTPKYSATVVVGGNTQTTQFRDAFPAPTGFDDDVIITKQSGELEITFVDDAAAAFDVSGLATTEAFVVPFNSDVTPVSLGSGVISGAGNNIYTVTWVKDTIPDTWSSFAQDNGGAIVLYVQLDETGDDYFQAFTRFNVDDGDFKGDAQTVPLIVFDYSWTTAISSEWAKYGRGTPLKLTDAAAFLAAAGKTDWGHVVDKDLVTSPAGVDNEQYILAGIGGDWSTGSIGDVARYSATDTAWYFKTPIEGDEVYVTDENIRYRYSGAAWVATAAGDMTKAVYDPTNINSSAFARANMTGSQLASTISDFDTEVSNNSDVTANTSKVSYTDAAAVALNTAKVSNETHTGDVTGATALTLESVSITGKTTETAVSGDFLLMSDTSDSGNLKKVDALDFLSGGGGPGSDTTAIHDDTPSEISAITEKLTPTTGDWLIIEDGADSNNKKRVDVSNLPTGGGGEANTASNVGTGAGQFKTKSGIDLQFRSNDSSDSSITIAENTDEVDFIVNQSAIAAGTDNNQTGTTYTLVLTDADNTTVWMNNAAANTLTIPTNASVAFAIGDKINVMMEGAGTTTIDGDTGVTVNGVSGGAVAINTQNQGATLTKRATDTWIVTGDIGTSGEAFNGFKENLIIDGQFNHWDEGIGPFVADGYTATMWDNDYDGAGTGVTRGTFTIGQTDVPYNPTYYLTNNNDATSVNIPVFQPIKDVSKTANTELTFSVYLKGSVAGTVGFRFVQHFGTGGSPSSDVEVSTTAQAITTSWVKYTLTFTPASISGKTLGTDNNSSLQIFVDQKGNSGTFEGTVDFANEALVYGSVAYDQSFPTPAEERHRIDEYYQIIGDYEEGVAGSNQSIRLNPEQAGTPSVTRRTTNTFRRTMRAIPAMTLPTPNNGSIGAITATKSSVYMVSSASTTTAGQAISHIIADARL